MTGLGIVGFLDDYIKVAKQRSLGLRAWAKLTGQMLIAVTFAILALQFPDPNGFTPASTEISFIRDTGRGAGQRPVRRLGLRDDRRHRPTA
jgi:phospho-N-acetylmuramoyl-pentapeptide-transferase